MSYNFWWTFHTVSHWILEDESGPNITISTMTWSAITCYHMKLMRFELCKWCQLLLGKQSKEDWFSNYKLQQWAWIARIAEHHTFSLRVVGSSPCSGECCFWHAFLLLPDTLSWLQQKPATTRLFWKSLYQQEPTQSYEGPYPEGGSFRMRNVTVHVPRASFCSQGGERLLSGPLATTQCRILVQLWVGPPAEVLWWLWWVNLWNVLR